MASSQTTVPGIVVRAHPSGDADIIVTILTPTLGKLSLISKHARKSKRRFCGSLDLFERGEFLFEKGRGSLPYLVSYSSGQPLRNLRTKLEKITLATLLCESFDLLVHDAADQESDFFSPLSFGLEAIDEATDLKSACRATYLVLSNLLEIVGYLDAENHPAPSLNNFRRLLKKIENVSERELRSRGAVEEILAPVMKANATKVQSSGQS